MTGSTVPVDPWAVCRDERGELYYWHRLTRETRRSPPADPPPPPEPPSPSPSLPPSPPISPHPSEVAGQPKPSKSPSKPLLGRDGSISDISSRIRSSLNFAHTARAIARANQAQKHFLLSAVDPGPEELADRLRASITSAMQNYSMIAAFTVAMASDVYVEGADVPMSEATGFVDNGWCTPYWTEIRRGYITCVLMAAALFIGTCVTAIFVILDIDGVPDSLLLLHLWRSRLLYNVPCVLLVAAILFLGVGYALEATMRLGCVWIFPGVVMPLLFLLILAIWLPYLRQRRKVLALTDGAPENIELGVAWFATWSDQIPATTRQRVYAQAKLIQENKRRTTVHSSSRMTVSSSSDSVSHGMSKTRTKKSSLSKVTEHSSEPSNMSAGEACSFGSELSLASDHDYGCDETQCVASERASEDAHAMIGDVQQPPSNATLPVPVPARQPVRQPSKMGMRGSRRLRTFFPGTTGRRSEREGVEARRSSRVMEEEGEESRDAG